MSRRAPAECRARAGGGDAPSRRERTAPVELRSLDLLNGVRRQPLGYNKPTVQAPHIQPSLVSARWKSLQWSSEPSLRSEPT